MLGVSRGWIYRRTRNGELPVMRLGSGPKAPIRIDPLKLEAWFAAIARDGRAEKAVMP